MWSSSWLMLVLFLGGIMPCFSRSWFLRASGANIVFHSPCIADHCLWGLQGSVLVPGWPHAFPQLAWLFWWHTPSLHWHQFACHGTNSSLARLLLFPYQNGQEHQQSNMHHGLYLEIQLLHNSCHEGQLSHSLHLSHSLLHRVYQCLLLMLCCTDCPRLPNIYKQLFSLIDE